MISRHEHTSGVWVDIEQPSEEEVRRVAHEFGISERIQAELLSPTPLPLVAGTAEMILLVLHFPTKGIEENETKDQEVDFVVGKNFILTVRYEVVAPLHHLRKLFETDELVGGNGMSSDTLLEVLFAHLYSAVRDHTTHVATRLERIERDMFGGQERATIRDISNTNREFLHLEAALAGQEEPLERFLTALRTRGIFDASFAERAVRIGAERAQVARLASTHRAVATELRETNVALLEAGQNEVMKTLTVINFIILPLELIAFIFGMSVPGKPLADNANAFWIIIAIMLALAGLLTIIFARKRWIF